MIVIDCCCVVVGYVDWSFAKKLGIVNSTGFKTH